MSNDKGALTLTVKDIKRAVRALKRNRIKGKFVYMKANGEVIGSDVELLPNSSA